MIPLRTIYVDLRCLQDLAYRERGIGTHVAGLLRGRAASEFSDARVVGLLDPDLPELPPNLRTVCDETTSCLNPITHPAAKDLYIQTSPMTHDIADTWSFRRERGLFSAAIIYDFIPFDWPGYLQTKASRINYIAALARLRSYDCFFPISRYAARRLYELAGASGHRVCVTGAAVRETLAAAARSLPPITQSNPNSASSPYALVVGGQDQRKNLDAAVSALRILRQQGVALHLQVVGAYTAEFQRALLESCPGGWLSFSPDISDPQLAALYAGAEVCIVPSHIEGFSLPVVEAAECGCPVLASSCDAHLELLDDSEALFSAADPLQLANRLSSLLHDPALRGRLKCRQSSISGQFLEQRVSHAFWSGLAKMLPAAFSIAHNRRPRLAFLSPYPPDQSGVALCTELTLAEAVNKFEISLYTDAPGLLSLPPGVRHAGPLTPAPTAKGAHDAVLLVLGNSHFHNPILDIAQRYGGPAILHDSRMTQLYYDRLGRSGFRTLAAKLLQRPISEEEIDRSITDQDPPTLFFEPLLARCRPVMVHSRPFQALLRARYGAESRVLPLPPNNRFSTAELTDSHRAALRHKLGLAPNSFAISTFGHVGASKAPAMSIVALELLRAWNVPAELYFVGKAGGYVPELVRIARLYGVEHHLHFFEDYVDPQTYRDFLIASDVAVQLRTHAFGQVSGALADCASAGLPAIAPASLIESCQAPAYCRPLPELHSALQLAEALAEAAAGTRTHVRDNPARTSYLQENCFVRYVDILAEVLGFA